MKTCPSCNHQNADTEEFCIGCGADLGALATSTMTATVTGAVVNSAASAAVAAAQPAARTITIGDQSFPLFEGKTVTIARADSPENPDIKLDDDSLSGTSLHLTIINGQLSVRYGGADEKPYSVVKNLKPSETMTVEPGEMLMLGNLVGVVV